MIASILERAEDVDFDRHDEGTYQSDEWGYFIQNLVDAVGSSPPSVSPCQPVPVNRLFWHLGRFGGLPSAMYRPLQLLLSDANPFL